MSIGSTGKKATDESGRRRMGMRWNWRESARFLGLILAAIGVVTVLLIAVWMFPTAPYVLVVVALLAGAVWVGIE
jgi:hypothetical protein